MKIKILNSWDRIVKQAYADETQYMQYMAHGRLSTNEPDRWRKAGSCWGRGGQTLEL